MRLFAGREGLLTKNFVTSTKFFVTRQLFLGGLIIRASPASHASAFGGRDVIHGVRYSVGPLLTPLSFQPFVKTAFNAFVGSLWIPPVRAVAIGAPESVVPFIYFF